MRRAPRPPPHESAVPRRSNAAMPITVAFLFLGLLFGTYTIIVPALLGVFLFLTALSFISTRLNPFSIGFYLTTKPSWPAIGLLFLSALLLLGAAYGYYASGLAPILPKL